MQHLDDGTIHARLDGALGADDAQRIDAHVSACGACADRVAEARGLIAASSRILMALDDVPAGVVPPAQARTAAAVQAASPAFAVAPPAARDAAPPARWWGMRYSRLAAALAFVAAGTFLLARGANRREAGSAGGPQRLTEPARAARESTAPRNEPMAAAPGAAGAAPRPEAPPAPAPAAALGGARPPAAPAPSLEPQVKSFAREERQQAASAKKSATDVNVAVAADAIQTADSASRAAEARSSSALARRIAEGKAVQLSEVVVTGQPGGAQSSPRLVSVDSVQRGPVMARRQTYRVGNGALVVLEVTPPAAMPNDSTRAAPAPASAGSPAVGGSSGAAIHVIRWRGADGTGYVLSGPVDETVLQRVRAALGNKP